jgi:Mce-associated membrane protein
VTLDAPPAPVRPPLPPAARRAAIALVVVATLLLASSVAFALTVKSHVDDRHALERAREAALTAARQEIVNLDSLAFSTIDRDLKRVLDGATGTFKTQFTGAQRELRAQVLERKSVSTGSIVSAGVVRADTNSATVLVAAERTVKDSSSASGGTAHDRWRVELEKHGGRWLVARLEPVA